MLITSGSERVKEIFLRGLKMTGKFDLSLLMNCMTKFSNLFGKQTKFYSSSTVHSSHL